MKFGNILKIALDKNELSAVDFAKELHVTDRTVYRWCNNTNEPDFDTLCKICIRLNIDFDDIIKLNKQSKTDIIKFAQDKNEMYILEEYRKLNVDQQKLYIKSIKSILNIFKFNGG